MAIHCISNNEQNYEPTFCVTCSALGYDRQKYMAKLTAELTLITTYQGHPRGHQWYKLLNYHPEQRRGLGLFTAWGQMNLRELNNDSESNFSNEYVPLKK